MRIPTALALLLAASATAGALEPLNGPVPLAPAQAEAPSPGRHPRTALLTVEVAVSSHDADRGLKVKLYARAGVPTYWIVDVPGKAVEVRTDPGPDGYRGLEVYGLDGAVPCPV